jgi:hypothetical protein
MVKAIRATLIVAILGMTWISNIPLLGQGFSGAVSGVVRDSNGGVVPGTSVTARNVESGLTRTGVTNAEGAYLIPELPIGQYEVSAEVSGFKKALQSGVTVAVAQQAVVNLTLELGNVSQTVTVEADAQLVNTTTTDSAGLIQEKQIADLPLNGRSYLDLLTLNAGSTSNQSNTTNGGMASFSIAGLRPDQVRFTINGIDYVGASAFLVSTGPIGQSGSLLGVDGVQEFNVLDNTYGAQYGKRAGAQVNIVTKSGTNQLHGSLFEYLRNNALDSRNFFDQISSTPQYQRNQFGGALGGPIRRDKLFVFGTYEGFRENLGETLFGYVPDVQARQGFYPNAFGQYVTAPNLAPGILPYIQNFFPAPNGPEVFQNGLPTGTAVYSSNPVRNTSENYWQARVDYQISSKDSLSFNLTVDRGYRSDPGSTQAGGPNFIVDNELDTSTYTAQETHIFSSTLVNVARFGYTKSYGTEVAPPIANFPSNLLFVKGPGFTNPGSLVITGGSFVTAKGQNLFSLKRLIYTASDDVTLTKGAHNLSMGFWISPNTTPTVGSNTSASAVLTYPSLLAALQDQPTTFTATTTLGALDFHYLQAAACVQDDIKLRSNLTVSLGVREESAAMPSESTGGASNFWFEPNSGNLLNPVPVFSPNNLFVANHAKALFQPRVAVAWDPTGKGTWSVRAGFGIYVDQQDQAYNKLYKNPPNGSAAFQNTPLLSILANGPLASVPLPPECTAVGQKGCTTYSPAPIDPDMHLPTVQQWSLNVEHQLAKNLKLTVGYLGSESYHLPQNSDSNTIQPLVCQNAAGCLAGGIQPSGVKAGIVPQGTYYVPVGNRPQPLLNGAFGLYYFGTSNYNALNVSLLHRASHGLIFKTVYTWSKVLDTQSGTVNGTNTNSTSMILNWYNRGDGRGPASFDIGQQFSTNFSYQLPFGKGEKFGSGASGLEQFLIGGWQWNGIVSARSGFPFSPQVGRNQSGDGQFQVSDVPNVVPGCQVILGVQSFKTTGKYFNPNCFTLPLAGTYGNAGRDQFFGPGFFNIDSSLFKQIPVRERLNLQFRVEFFNILNHANFAAPSAIIFSGAAINGAAGNITNTATNGNGRQIQFALRVAF